MPRPSSMPASRGPAPASALAMGATGLALGIEQLEPAACELRQGGVYWLLCEAPADAERLLAQLLAGLEANHQAVLMADRAGHAALLARVPADRGPSRLALHDLPAARAPRALQRLVGELARLDAPDGALLLLRTQASHWQSLRGEPLRQWLRRVRDELAPHRQALLVIAEGAAAELTERLLPLNDDLSGLAQLYRGQGGPRYLLHHWRNALGVCGTRDLALRDSAAGFALVTSGPLRSGESAEDDQRLVLAEREALEGAPTPDRWQVFEDAPSLRARALRARGASVVFVLHQNPEVEALARTLHEIRQARGVELKLVVREMAPCLRYRDEQLLLAGGATLIVPHGSHLSRFLTLLESIQGQVWQRNGSDDFEALLERLRPLPLSGLLGAAGFAEAVRQMWSGRDRGEISHQLLRLAPREGLDLAAAAGQMRLRRHGDIACIADGNLYLFLFACRAEAVEPALDNVFLLAWQEIFGGYETLADASVLAHPAFLERAIPAAAANGDTLLDRVAPAGTPERGAAEHGPQRLQPRPVRIVLEEVAR